MKQSFFDVQSPIFRPVWRRVVVVALTIVWTLFEMSNGAYVWALIFGAAASYLTYQFFVVFDPKDPDENEQE